MLDSPTFSPLFHGAAGLLDELLLFGAPLIVVIIILVIASRRARKNAPPRERASHDTPNRPPDSPHDSAGL
jgi:hypothetical protein